MSTSSRCVSNDAYLFVCDPGKAQDDALERLGREKVLRGMRATRRAVVACRLEVRVVLGIRTLPLTRRGRHRHRAQLDIGDLSRAVRPLQPIRAHEGVEGMEACRVRLGHGVCRCGAGAAQGRAAGRARLSCAPRTPERGVGVYERGRLRWRHAAVDRAARARGGTPTYVLLLTQASAARSTTGTLTRRLRCATRTSRACSMRAQRRTTRPGSARFRRTPCP